MKKLHPVMAVFVAIIDILLILVLSGVLSALTQSVNPNVCGYKTTATIPFAYNGALYQEILPTALQEYINTYNYSYNIIFPNAINETSNTVVCVELIIPNNTTTIASVSSFLTSQGIDSKANTLPVMNVPQ